MEYEARIQQFYVQHNCIEHVMNFEQLCALMGALSSKLKESAQENKDVTIVFACACTVEPSSVHDNVLTKRTIIPLEVKLSPRGSNRLRYTDCDDFALVQEYFNV